MSDYLEGQAIRDVLQEEYGDATQTVLDDKVANRILQALRARGWASPQDVALMVTAAGGRITIPEDVKVSFDETGWQLRSWDDPASAATVIALARS